MALFDVIQKSKDDGNLIWRYPKRDFNTSSQLIVHEGQEAVFFSDGKALDTFGPGRYTLNTNNIPLLKNLFQLTTGFRKPFQCEVYFIDKSEMASKWGTSSKIQFLEPKYNFPIEIGACGEMRFVIEDAKKILTKLVGVKKTLDNTNIDDFFQAYILLKVKTYIAQIITNEKICIFEIDQKLEQFSEELKEKLKQDFEEYGIRLDKFFVTNIAKPEDDKQYKEFKELYFKQTVVIANAELQQKIDIIEQETKSKKVVMSAEAEATKREKEGYTYKEERQYDIGEKIAENEAVGEFTNIGVGLGMISGVGGTVSDKVNTQISGAFANIENKCICTNCKTENDNSNKFCKNCGAKLEKIKICKKCNAKLDDDAKFCSNCGERID